MTPKHSSSSSAAQESTPGQASSGELLADQQVAQMAQLVGGLAHELRNPLSTVMVNLQLLAEDLRDETAHPEDTRRRALIKVEVLQRETARLQTLFDQFLNLTGPYGLNRSQADINDIVTNLANFVEPQLRGKGIHLNLQLAPSPLKCQVDAPLIRQALLNIMINAEQAMLDGGTLTLLTRPGQGAVEIVVTDTGVGIEPGDLERILNPFFSTKTVGTGLGLSITQRIIQEHDGTLSFVSTPGKGTTVTVHLPQKTGESDIAE